jgi:hypothetical protein
MLKKAKKLRSYSDYSLNALLENCNIDSTKAVSDYLWRGD